MRGAAGVLLALVVALGLVALLPPAPASACSCMEPRPVSDGVIAEHDAVFTGEVVATGRRGGERRIEVAVDEVWRGEVRATTVIVSPDSSSACGVGSVDGPHLFLTTEGPDPGVLGDGGDVLAVYSCGGLRSTARRRSWGRGSRRSRAASDRRCTRAALAPGSPRLGSSPPSA